MRITNTKKSLPARIFSNAGRLFRLSMIFLTQLHNKACDHIQDKTDHCKTAHIRELGFYVVDNITARSGTGHNGGIGDR